MLGIAPHDETSQLTSKIKDKDRKNALTQYRLLTMQLNLHFVYNTMSRINVLIAKETAIVSLKST